MKLDLLFGDSSGQFDYASWKKLAAPETLQCDVRCIELHVGGGVWLGVGVMHGESVVGVGHVHVVGVVGDNVSFRPIDSCWIP